MPKFGCSILKGIRNSIWQLSGGWQRSLEDVNEPDIKSGAPTGSDAYRAGRLEFTFENYPEKRKKTHLFSAFDSDVQKFLKSRVELNVEEQPVLAFYEDANTWHWQPPGELYGRLHAACTTFGIKR